VATFRSYFIITLGLLVNALGWTAFLLPAKLVGGGASGIGSVVFFATGFPVGLTVLILNGGLILVAIRVLGTQFGVKTVYGIAVLSCFLVLFQRLIHQPIVQDNFMATVLGGACAGAGMGIVFSQGGSTGGTDIVAMIVNKYRNITPGKVILALDVFIIASSYLVFHSLEKIVYGYVSMAVVSYAVDMILEGTKESAQLFVFSPENRAIADRISQEMARGITLFRGQGWHTKQEMDVVMVVVRKQEIQRVLAIVRDLDYRAFVSVGQSVSVYGKGFENLRL